MIKATAGGGGKGMRICASDEDVMRGYPLSVSEAETFFGDGRVFLEKYIESPHHIEIQILAAVNSSSSGGEDTLECVCFPERECSIQRRNQKIVEESPSVLLTDETRRDMVRQVTDLVLIVGYTSAGTVEFLVDQNQNFYFLEMNTRLQVEHPVTEMITGVDLVEEMIRIAAGYPISPLLLESARNSPTGMVPHEGHAIECRIYAEDPQRNFLPSTGPLLQYREPVSSPHELNASTNCTTIRVDSGVIEGSTITQYYDPLMAKLITHATTPATASSATPSTSTSTSTTTARTNAIDEMLTALDRFVITGVQHNLRFLHSVLRHPKFFVGRTPTNFIALHYSEKQGGGGGLALNNASSLSQRNELLHRHFQLATMAFLIREYRDEKSGKVFQGAPDSPRVVVLNGLFEDTAGSFLVWTEHTSLGRMVLSRQLHSSEPEFPTPTDAEYQTLLHSFDCDDDVHPLHPIATGLLENTTESSSAMNTSPTVCHHVQIHSDDECGVLSLQCHGILVPALAMSVEEYQLAKHMRPPLPPSTSISNKQLLSPMPGVLLGFAVREGDVVELDQELCTVEAMKMQNVLRSTRKGGVVTKLCVDVGDTVRPEDVLIEFD
mmetsp:Transcript_7978/g.9325  ORF Transcript_7978/g.9325 Transcript_7978/m.9325 type:complete len:608 (+) Transcript_7978:2-1825(+)